MDVLNATSTPDPRKDPPFQHETNRTLWIGWGANGVSLALQIIVGGLFFGYLFLFGSIVMVVRGWKPSWFAVHHEQQPIAGTPYRRTESPHAWLIAILASLGLAIGSTWTHHRVAPEKPDLAKTILGGVKQLWEQRKPDVAPAPGPSQPKTDTAKSAPAPEPPRPAESTKSRANLYCQEVTLRISENGPEKDQTIKFPDITGRVSLQNIGGSPLTSQAIISVGATVSEKLNADGLDRLFQTGYGKNAAFTPPDLAQGANFPVDFRSLLITPSEWNDVKGGARLIYVTVEAFFGDRYGRRKSEHCSYFRSIVGVAGLHFVEQSCVLHNGVIDLQ